MIPPTILHPMHYVAASISSVEELMQHPLALPVAVGAVTVFLTILLFYNISESMRKQNDTDIGGKKAVRRSSRSSKGRIESIDITPLVEEESQGTGANAAERRSRSATRASSRKTASKSPANSKTRRSRSASSTKKTGSTSSGTKTSASKASAKTKTKQATTKKPETTRRSTSAKRSASAGAKKEASTVKPKKTVSKTTVKKTTSRSTTPSRRRTTRSSS